MSRGPEGPTPARSRYIVAITALSVAHHIDHVLRGVTGWPIDGAFNPFSGSLLVYPVIAAGAWLTQRRRVGARFWALLAGAAAVFIAAVHVGPAAGDAVSDIPNQYASPIAGVVALALLAALFGGLVAHTVHELRSLAGRTPPP